LSVIDKPAFSTTVNTFRTREVGVLDRNSVFTVVHRVYRPENDLMFFITTNASRLDYHLENDENLMGNVLSKGTLTPGRIDWGELRRPLTEQIIPELLRRAFVQCYIDEFHLEEFLSAQVFVSSRPLGTTIAQILGKTIH
jgi:hypothetical protein